MEYHFFSEPGPMNDHCPVPKPLCIQRYESTVCQTFFFIAFSVTGNVVEHRHKYNSSCEILGCFSQSVQQTFHFTIELQRIESWEDVPLEFCRLSTDSIKVSVALRRCNPFYSLLPSFVGFRILMDLPKTQYRI